MKSHLPFLLFLLLFSCSTANSLQQQVDSEFEPEREETKYIRFSLLNPDSVSIPLIIPSVMNPNLSPNSRSGVTLRMGQEILFKARGKKQVLLTVDESISEGDELDVSKLLEKRKKELGLK